MRSGNVNWIYAAAVALWAGSIAQGSPAPISYLVQNRSVSANSSVTGLTRGGTSSSPVTDQQSHSQQASGFGDFDGSASVDSNVGPQSAEATASGTQQSTLGATGFSASGAVRADSFNELDGPASGSSASAFHITFNVEQAESYTFTANLNSSLDFASIGSDSVNIELTDSGGADVFAPVTSINLSKFEVQGTLAPGTYSFKLDTSAASDDQSNNFVNYSVALADGPAASSTDGNLINRINPVPLPSALTDSLVMLCGLSAIGLIRGRIPRRNRA